MTNSSLSPPRRKPMDYCREGEGKEFDSPMTTDTDLSSSYDDQSSVMTPPPMTSRLGRIILSSSADADSDAYGDAYGDAYDYAYADGYAATTATNTDSSSDGGGAAAAVSRTATHRGLNLRRPLAATRPPQPKETENVRSPEETTQLINALHQLQRLATLDSTEYQQRLLENSLPALQTEQPNPLYFPALNGGTLQQQQQQIRELPQPVQTPLVQLSMSIHRLHAVVANITREVDGHTDEVRELQSRLEALEIRNRRLEAAAKKVHTKNLGLKQQLMRDRRVAHELKHTVRSYEAKLESQGFQLLASRVQNHEIQLQLSKNNNTGNNVDGVGGGEGQQTQTQTQMPHREQRERTHSSMSSGSNDFLDIEQESLCDDNASDDHYGSTIQSMGSTVSAHSEFSDHHPLSSSCELSPTTRPLVSQSHSVFEDTMPTLRYSAKGVLKSGREKVPSSSDITTASGLDGFHPGDTASPKREQHTQQQQQQTNKNGGKGTTETGKKSESFSNRFAKFLGSRAIATYNLKMTPPCNIQFVELPLNATQQQASRSSSKKTTMYGDGNDDDDDKTHRCAFCVCGLDGFDETNNMKPTIGARLTKINGKAIDDDDDDGHHHHHHHRWSLEGLYRELDQTSKDPDSRPKQIVLTFRNETLDNTQHAMVVAAMKRNKKERAAADVATTKESAASCGSDANNTQNDTAKKKTNNNGASLFEKSSQEQATEEAFQNSSSSNISATSSNSSSSNSSSSERDGFQRVRTASTDSVGMAISGIGNFLQNFNHHGN